MLHELKPSCRDYIWGGTRLKEEYNKHSDAPIIAETWELSCHDDAGSFLVENNLSLKNYLDNNPDFAGTACKKFEDFPMLIKLIDAKQNLSIQVHPSNEYARKNENDNGKTEVWYIVDADDGAFIYYGFAKTITADEFEIAIENNTLTDVLNKVYVKKGDVFFVESGTIHAIGAGCLIAEVQQNSNVTYRVYDYGRVGNDGKPRELHVQKAKDVTNLSKIEAQPNFAPHIASCEYFTTDVLNVNDTKNIEFIMTKASFAHLLVLEGQAKIVSSDSSISLSKGGSVFADANDDTLIISGNAEILVSYIK